MEKKITHPNGKMYLVCEEDGKRTFCNEEGAPLAGLELNVVRNWYESKVEPEDPETPVGSGWHIIKAGERIYADTHADFLNRLLGLHLSRCWSSSWRYDDITIWMVYFDNTERDGWRNYFISEDECCQVNGDHIDTWKRKDIEKITKGTRAVFERRDNAINRTYIFRGLFVYDESKSDPLDRVYYKKTSDEFRYFIKG